MQPTHKSTGHTEGDEEHGFTFVHDGPLCQQKGQLYTSADWIAVDCPRCLAMRQENENA